MRIVDRAVGADQVQVRARTSAEHVAPAVAALHRTRGQEIGASRTDRESKGSRVKQQRVLPARQPHGLSRCRRLDAGTVLQEQVTLLARRQEIGRERSLGFGPARIAIDGGERRDQLSLGGAECLDPRRQIDGLSRKYSAVGLDDPDRSASLELAVGEGNSLRDGPGLAGDVCGVLDRQTDSFDLLGSIEGNDRRCSQQSQGEAAEMENPYHA